jgi:hypothetical protein
MFVAQVDSVQPGSLVWHHPIGVIVDAMKRATRALAS